MSESYKAGNTIINVNMLYTYVYLYLLSLIFTKNEAINCGLNLDSCNLLLNYYLIKNII